jgi:hypothetical protein
MLNFHVPLGWFRAANRRSSRSYNEKSDARPTELETKDAEGEVSPGKFASGDGDQNSEAERQPSRVVIFFRGVCRATSIGMFVALLLAVAPGFEPNIGPFQARLLDFIQWYGIPVSSALLI